jgi:hypothetical protein
MQIETSQAEDIAIRMKKWEDGTFLECQNSPNCKSCLLFFPLIPKEIKEEI